MTANEFRRLALAMSQACESSHMGHPDFRLRGKVFATLGYPDRSHAVVKLTPEQQQVFTGTEPDTFAPVTGRWGLRGATIVRLRAAGIRSVRAALRAAWTNVAPRELLLPPEEK
jgi:hypothetical protein